MEGGGRASARETACRTAAGAIAEKILEQQGIIIVSYLKAVGNITIDSFSEDPDELLESIKKSASICPNQELEKKILERLEKVKADGDSLGGIVECQVHQVPAGLGDPMYEKTEQNLASAMLSIPASKGFEMGDGIQASKMQGSEHNDAFISDGRKIRTASNHAGGTLGGITNGMPLVFRVHFKPTSSIKKEQKTVDREGQKQSFQLPEGSRHDPALVIRAVPVVQAMSALVVVDAWLAHRLSRLENLEVKTAILDNDTVCCRDS